MLTLLFVPLVIKLIAGQPWLGFGPSLTDQSLVGVVITEKQPSLTLSTWLSGQFQTRYAAWFGQTFPARALLVRTSNQLDFSLFGKSYMYGENIIIGKQGHLYEMQYLVDYLNIRPRMSPAQMESLVVRMATLQTRLKQRGMAFILLLTPSKAAIYPQYIPDYLLPYQKDGPRNYEILVPMLRKYGIHCVDGHQITKDALRGADVPLFSRGGTHWNYCGAFYTVRELIHAIESEWRGGKLPALYLAGTHIDNHPTGPDRDLAYLLNLLKPPVSFPACHPVIKKEAGKANRAASGKVVFIGGSFLGQPLEILDENQVFREMDYYYYYKTSFQSFPGGELQPLDVVNINWENDIFRADAIVLEINEEALGTGKDSHFAAFLDDALKHLPERRSLDEGSQQ